MASFVEFVVTQHKVILVEVPDESCAARELAEQTAYESVDGDVGDIEYTGWFEHKPKRQYDDVILMEDYLEEDDVN